jgi:hypothetical protein
MRRNAGRAAISLASASLGMLLVACGGIGHGPGPAVTRLSSGAAVSGGASATRGYRTGDGDDDDLNGKDRPGFHDDVPITEYGHAAGVSDREAVAALVKRYYSIAATGDGKAGCSLVYSRLAKNPGLTKTVPEDRYSEPVLPHVSRGESCAQVATKLFTQHRKTLPAEATTVRVTGVRVDGIHGVALLGFATAPERWLPIAREGRVWKLHALLAGEFP